MSKLWSLIRALAPYSPLLLKWIGQEIKNLFEAQAPMTPEERERFFADLRTYAREGAESRRPYWSKYIAQLRREATLAARTPRPGKPDA